MPEAAQAQIFVSHNGDDTISEYNLDGTTVNTALVSGLSTPSGIAVAGGEIFVANRGSSTIGEYNLDGTPVNAALIPVENPFFMAAAGGDLFVTDGNGIGEYTTSGTTVDASLVPGDGAGIAVVAPEPTMPALAVVGGLSLLLLRRRRK